MWIKDFSVEMDIKNKGVEFDISNNDGSHKGDLYVTKTGITWCSGRTGRENGKKISWEDFAQYMMQRP